MKKFIKRANQYIHAGDNELAIKCLQKALKLNPNEGLLIHRKLGGLFLKLERFNEASEQFDLMIKINPSDPSGLIAKAKLAQKRADWETALLCWEQCLNKFSEIDNPVWRNSRANVLIKLEYYDTAELEFKKLAHTYPQEPWGAVGLARISNETKQWEQSLILWEQCFEHYPKHIKPWWYNKKRDALVALGKIHNAREEMKKQSSSYISDEYFFMSDDNHKFLKNNKDSQLNYKSILIVTYGRSGSTLLQGVLNSINGVIVRGENNNTFSHLYHMVSDLEMLKRKRLGAILPNQPWYGISIINHQDVMSHCQNLARTILLADYADNTNMICYGFKEIRYHELGDDFDQYLDFLSELLPNPAIIFNTRNLGDVTNSAWWQKQNSERVINRLRKMERRFQAYGENRKNCFHISYEDVVSKSHKLEKLFDFLGAPYSPERVDTILSVSHSHYPKST